MGLRNLTFAEHHVELPGGGSFAVRGLSPDKVLSLYNRHSGQLSALFDSYMGKSDVDVQVLAGSLIGDAPNIMAELIALASGSTPAMTSVEEGQTLTDWERDVEAARDLAFPVQIDALMKVAELTFSSSMPPGKFFAVVVKMAGATTAVLMPPKD